MQLQPSLVPPSYCLHARFFSQEAKPQLTWCSGDNKSSFGRKAGLDDLQSTFQQTFLLLNEPFSSLPSLPLCTPCYKTSSHSSKEENNKQQLCRLLWWFCFSSMPKPVPSVDNSKPWEAIAGARLAENWRNCIRQTATSAPNLWCTLPWSFLEAHCLM